MIPVQVSAQRVGRPALASWQADRTWDRIGRRVRDWCRIGDKRTWRWESGFDDGQETKAVDHLLDERLVALSALLKSLEGQIAEPFVPLADDGDAKVTRVLRRRVMMMREPHRWMAAEGSLLLAFDDKLGKLLQFQSGAACLLLE